MIQRMDFWESVEDTWANLGKVKREMNRDQIQKEAEKFFEWDDPDRKHYVTYTYCLLFAEHIAKMVLKEYRDTQLLIEAAIKTLNDNLHLCDGDVCTLRELRDAVAGIAPDWMGE